MLMRQLTEGAQGSFELIYEMDKSLGRGLIYIFILFSHLLHFLIIVQALLFCDQPMRERMLNG